LQGIVPQNGTERIGSMQSVALMAVYLGHLPGYLPVWLNSCGFCKDIDFFLLTDHPEDVPYIPANVRVIRTSLDELRERFSAVLGFPATLGNAYKLCDYKPLLGAAFKDVVSSYDFWGHVDIDVFFGRLRNFFPDSLDSFLRLYNRGHLSLYRNDPEGNSLFRLPNSFLDWRKVFSSPDYFHFDEGPGIAFALRENSLPHYVDNRTCADVTWRDANIRLSRADFNEPPQIFAFDRGRVLQMYFSNGEPAQREFGYFHFQKRKVPRLPPKDWEEINQWVFTTHGILSGLPELSSKKALAVLDKPDYFQFYRVLRGKLKREITIVKHPPLPVLPDKRQG
jgi:hypothetical protein